jgi:hypothetical protein
MELKQLRDALRPLRHVHEMVYFRATGSRQLRGRFQLPSLLNAHRLWGDGVEVGVFEGWFSDYMLTYWQGRKLVSIDPWMAWGDEYNDDCNRDQVAMDRLYIQTRARLARHSGRSVLWRMTSAEGAVRTPDQSLSFVYIDAQHHEAAVRDDLELWFPKIEPGGILAGHDYMDGVFPFGMFGVKTAVDQFFSSRNIPVYVTGEVDSPSWFVVTPKCKE